MLIKVASLLQQLVVHKIRPAASIRLDDINGNVMIRLDDILPYTHVKNTSSIRLAIRAIEFAMHRGKSRPRATSPALALFMSARFSLVSSMAHPGSRSLWELTYFMVLVPRRPGSVPLVVASGL